MACLDGLYGDNSESKTLRSKAVCAQFDAAPTIV